MEQLRGVTLGSLPSPFGKYQYICSSDKGEVSLIELTDDFHTANWEIMCIKGSLFEDIERFNTKQEAETRCREVLD